MYRIVCVFTAGVCAALFPVLLINGGFYIDTYGVTPDAGADFLGRRVSPMFLGFAILLWMVRGFPVGSARDAVCFSMVVAWAGIAATGVYEYMVGTASVAIVGAAAFEFAFAVGFLIARKR